MRPKQNTNIEIVRHYVNSTYLTIFEKRIFDHFCCRYFIAFYDFPLRGCSDAYNGKTIVSKKLVTVLMSKKLHPLALSKHKYDKQANTPIYLSLLHVQRRSICQRSLCFKISENNVQI